MRLSRERLLLLVLLAAVVAVWGLVLAGSSRYLTITVLDVGQGDSILVQVPRGRTMLVDGGGTAGEETRGYDVGQDVVLPALLARRVRKIDVLVITHPHDDHIGGLRAVVEQVPVGLVLDPMLDEQDQVYRELRQLLAAKKIPVRRATEGQQINLGEGVKVELLNPPDPRLRGAGADTNDNSVVMRLTDGEFGMLFPGDIEKQAGARMARLGDGIRSTVLKVPHHGSHDIVESRFIEAVKPALAVISVGAHNSFGHPAPEVLDELKRVGATVLRTDEDGAITIRVRPPEWWARGYLGGSRAKRTAGRCSAGRCLPLPGSKMA